MLDFCLLCVLAVNIITFGTGEMRMLQSADLCKEYLKIHLKFLNKNGNHKFSDLYKNL
jgi:hypothetical protein